MSDDGRTASATRWVHTVEFATYERAEAEHAYEMLETFMATNHYSGVLSIRREIEDETDPLLFDPRAHPASGGGG